MHCYCITTALELRRIPGGIKGKETTNAEQPVPG
jgi:hypothetical protein